jgi:hypothetical protein
MLLMMVFGALLFAAVRYKDLPVGKVLNEVLIVRPATWLAKNSLVRIALTLALLCAAAAIWAEIGPLLIAADISPLLWVADMSLYLDAVVMVGVAFAAVQVKFIGRVVRNGLQRRVGASPARHRARARSLKVRRPKRPSPTNDDEPALLIRVAA